MLAWKAPNSKTTCVHSRPLGERRCTHEGGISFVCAEWFPERERMNTRRDLGALDEKQLCHEVFRSPGGPPVLSRPEACARLSIASDSQLRKNLRPIVASNSR